MEFAAPTPPCKPKVKAYASNESAMCHYCRFARATLSLPSMEGFDTDFDLGVEQGDSNQSDGLSKCFSYTLIVHYGIN